MNKITYKYSHIKKWLCCFTRFLVFEGHRLTHTQHRPFWTGRWRTGRRPPELLQSLWSHGAGWWSTEHHLLLLLCSGVWYWNTDGPEKTYTARVRWWSKMDDTSGNFSPTFLVGQLFMTSCHHHNMEARFPHVKKKKMQVTSHYFDISSHYFEVLSHYFDISSYYFEIVSHYFEIITVSHYFEMVSHYFEITSQQDQTSHCSLIVAYPYRRYSLLLQ